MAIMETKYIAAIDFGTAFTGVAYAVRKRDITPIDIKVKEDWKNTADSMPRKVPTSVLFNKYNQVIAYGYEAEARASVAGNVLFKHFKMSLHTQNMIFDSDTTLTSIDGKSTKPASEVVSKALEYLGGLVKNFIMQEHAPPHSLEITWVITVPAIWNISLRKFMRKVVKEAGLCTVNCSNLVIGLEPECAALYMKQKHGEMKDQHYAIVDCGGGTVDVAYHRCRPSGSSGYTCIDELKASTGEPKGGTLADRNFEKLIDQVFGYGTIDTIKRKNLAQYLQLMKEFEMSKPNINDGEAKNISYFRFLPNANNKITGVSIDISGFVVIEDDKFNSLFQEPVDWIRSHLAENLRSVPSVEQLYFTGGFSKCKLLQDHVSGLGPSVIFPNEKDLTVVKGAVIFGNNPGIVKSRKMPMSYGIMSNSKYDPEKHKGRATQVKEGVTYCSVVFSPLIRKEETIITDEDNREPKKYNPMYEEQTRINFTIYASPDPNVQFTDDPGCEKIGSMTLEIPDTTGGREREIKVITTFTGKELHTRAYSKQDNTEIHCLVSI